jgi:NADH:ubiquinone oxidoreductase subunit 4 (subunit M)
MKNKIIRFSIVTAVCLVVWAVTTFVRFTNPKIPDFFRGFSMGMGVVAGVALIYNIVIALKQKDSKRTVN